MRAIILAAGVGQRLAGSGHDGPKCLLQMGPRTLLQRHLDALAALGVTRVDLCIGYQADNLRAALHDFVGLDVHTRVNPEFTSGSVLSLWTMRPELTFGDEVLLMDADVLYAPALLARLASTSIANCFLVDRDFESGDEPVKLCVRDGRLVEFSKRIAAGISYEWCGESVGFFRLSAAMARRLAERTEAFVNSGRRDAPYEDAIRELLLEDGAAFGFEDVTGLPWIEIDFPVDVIRARTEILPQIEDSLRTDS
jgi:choline kinase